MVTVEMKVPKRVNKIGCLQVANLGDHHRQQCVGGDIERNTKENIGFVDTIDSLILVHPRRIETAYDKGESHMRNLPNIQALTIILRLSGDFNLLNDFIYLVNAPSVAILPSGPLGTVNRPQIPIFVGPFILNRDFILPQVTDICIPFQKPQKLMNHRLQVNFLSRDQWETFSEVITTLGSKKGDVPVPVRRFEICQSHKLFQQI